jgi:hypothetical protein
MKNVFIGVILFVLVFTGVMILRSLPKEAIVETVVEPDVLDTVFTVDGKEFVLVDGKGELSAAPGSVTAETLAVFGDPVYADYDNDGDTDGAVLLVHETGGTGVFYYAALALLKGDTYVATNAMLLGDRIAPQNIGVVDGRAVYNFAVRKGGEPYTTEPSVGASVFVHYDKATQSIGEWVSDFEGESDYTERFSARIDRVDVVFEQKDYTSYRLITNGAVREGELNSERGFENDPNATVYVLNWQKPEAQQMRYVRFTNEPMKLYLLDSDLKVVTGSALSKDTGTSTPI